ncbi:MAG: metal ABC transporter ATP-binding protein [Candidatus Lokiarchaeota archaeon]|nr:metal ABC transporter ATP-binding protein [Candidatus Lokiarchaeota archaeon]
MFEKSYNPDFLEALQVTIESKKPLKKPINRKKTPLIRLRGVNTVYEGEKFPTLYDINLEINEGEFIFIMGPNGSGKTTLLETILGLLPVEKGILEVKGVSAIKKGRQLRREIGYLIQGVEFDPQTPFLVKNALMTARSGRMGLLRFPSKADWKIVRYCFDALRNKEEIADYWDRPIGKLSGGMQQKVLLASVLAAEPNILLLDEPFSNLDVKSRHEIFAMLSRLNKLANVTVLCVSHGTTVPKEVDRVIMIQKGRIVLDNKTEEAIKSEKFKAYCHFMVDVE